MNRRMRFFLALECALLGCLMAAGAFAGGPDAWISPDGTLTADAITFSKNEGKGYTLYLPGNLDTKDMKFGVADGVSFTYGSRNIKTGDSAEIVKVGTVQFRLSKEKGSLTVIRGSAGLPAVYVTTESGSLKNIEAKKENREPGLLVLRGPDGEVQYDGALEHVKCRGNSSMTFKKKNYQIKLEKSTNLLGMGKAKKWILTGNYRDKSYLRNQIMLDLAADIGLKYTPEHMPAELYINHEYRGLYLFSEKVEIDKDRVAIANLESATKKLNEKELSEYKFAGRKKSSPGSSKAYDIPADPEDITGGYLVEFESYPARYRQEASAYTTKKGSIIVVKSPEYVSVAQMKYISSLCQSFENAVMAKDGKDPGSGKHYTEIADAESLALKYMIEEISENYDGNSSSQYFYKPADSVSEKLYAGPVWDYDSTFGAYASNQRNAKYVLNPAYLWIAKGDWNAWYPALYRHEDFRALVAELWNGRVKEDVEILLGLRESEKEGLQSIDRWQKAIESSAAMDRVRWPRPANSSTVAQTGNTFEANIKFLKDYLKQRYDFLNETWGSEK
ncbi:MAG: CotH kinase family protein [Clostridiales bacterium]|nr:CotH kinase family protein [Clostridiales bacterium]